MCIDTNRSKNWNPYRALAIMGAWLVLVTVIAFALACGCTGDTPASLSADGSVSLAWSITEGVGASTCDQVGARRVVLRLRPRNRGDVVITAMPCATSPGTKPVPVGRYDIAIELHANDGTRIASAPDQTDVSITAGRVTTLTPVKFTATMKFGLVVTFATPAITNCQPVARGGAGMTGTAFWLERADPGRAGCEAATFTRMLGTTPRGSYTVDCGSPSVMACVEKNETLTTSVGAGNYRIHAIGKNGANDCWQRDDTITVIAAGRPTRHPVGLRHLSGPGC